MSYEAKMKTSRPPEHKCMRLGTVAMLLVLFAVLGVFQLYAQTITTGELGGRWSTLQEPWCPTQPCNSRVWMKVRYPW